MSSSELSSLEFFPARDVFEDSEELALSSGFCDDPLSNILRFPDTLRGAIGDEFSSSLLVEDKAQVTSSLNDDCDWSVFARKKKIGI